MPVLSGLARRFSEHRPLEGVRISGCLHITTETANLTRTLKTAGADIVLCASNSLSTQDNAVHNVSVEIDQEVARLKLNAMKVQVDQLTEAQHKYLSSWQEGT
jgi:adenosylhomocysteinase